MSHDDDLQEPLLEPILSSPEPEPAAGRPLKKRKRGTEAPLKSKKPKQKSANDDDDGIDTDHGINTAIAAMDSQLLSDYLGQKTRRFENELSSIELEERYMPAVCIRDSSSFALPRSLANLPTYLEQHARDAAKLWTASKKKGAPHTIVVAGAGLRASEIARAVRKFQTKDAVVAKLFAKHIKLKDSVKFLHNSRVGMAVGTPARLQDLMEDGALSLENLQRIVIDASHVDVKKRGILEMRETQVPLMKWLNSEKLKERYTSDEKHIDLLFY